MLCGRGYREGTQSQRCLSASSSGGGQLVLPQDEQPPLHCEEKPERKARKSLKASQTRIPRTMRPTSRSCIYQAGSTKMLEAIGSSRLRVLPLSLTIQCCLLRLSREQSGSSTVPGRTPRVAILPQIPRSPLIRQTLTRRLHPQHSESGRAPPCSQSLLLPNR